MLSPAGSQKVLFLAPQAAKAPPPIHEVDLMSFVENSCTASRPSAAQHEQCSGAHCGDSICATWKVASDTDTRIDHEHCQYVNLDEPVCDIRFLDEMRRSVMHSITLLLWGPSAKATRPKGVWASVVHVGSKVSFYAEKTCLRQI